MSARPLLMKVRSLISGFSLSHWFVTYCIKVGVYLVPTRVIYVIGNDGGFSMCAQI